MGNSGKNITSSREQLMYFYIEKRDLTSITALLQKHPDLLEINLTKDTHHTPLMRAAYNGDLELITAFVKMGAKVNSVNKHTENALIVAVRRAHSEAVELLLSLGADASLVSEYRMTPIDYAILGGFYQAARTLLGSQELLPESHPEIKNTESESNLVSHSKPESSAHEELPESSPHFSIPKEKLNDTAVELNKDRPVPRSVAEYEALAIQHKYRYVNYSMFLEGLAAKRPEAAVGNYLKKHKPRLNDPVLDPNETWGSWVKRVANFEDAPLVERDSLPAELQPQNRLFGKVHHYLHKVGQTHTSQTPSLAPVKPREVLT